MTSASSSDRPSWEGMLGSAPSRVAASILFAGALCLFLACCVYTGNSDDDWTVSFYLSGRIDGQGLSLHVNALLSQLVYGLNSVLSNLNWFFVIEHLIAFGALAALVYGVLTWWRSASGVAVLALVIALVMPNCISSSNYTYVAFFATAVGGAILTQRLRDPSVGLPAMVAGGLLLASGLALRLQMFAMGLPFLALAVLWVLWSQRGQVRVSDLPRVLLPLGVVALVCCGMLLYDHVVWQQDGWRQWREYNEPRTAISDYPMPEYPEAKDSLDEAGVSENDYFMLRNWASADVDALDTATISRVAELQIKPDLSPSAIVASLADYVRQSLDHLSLFGPLLVAFILLMVEARNSRALVLLELCVALAVCLYFYAAGRLPDRVEEPAWLYACIACLAASLPREPAGERPVRDWRRWVVCGVGGAMLVGGLAYTVHRHIPYFSVDGLRVALTQAEVEASGPISSYVEEHPDSAFVADTGTYTRFEKEYGYRYLPRADTATRMLPLGGWGSGSPFRRRQSELLGATNPFEALVSDDATYLITSPDMAERVLVFLREHYDPQVTMAQVDTVLPDGQDTPVWDFIPSDAQ